MTPDPSASFAPEDKRRILGFVRGILSAACAGARDPDVPDIPLLAENGACFVTLRENGSLRGCIGTLEAFEPLAENLRRNAENAAFSDPAFPPLEAGELDFITIEVSLLYPPRRLASPEAAELGRDGLLLVRGSRRAVFLPQVVAEQRWDHAAAWSNLARKAGVPPESWRDAETALYAFACDTFSE